MLVCHFYVLLRHIPAESDKDCTPHVLSKIANKSYKCEKDVDVSESVYYEDVLKVCIYGNIIMFRCGSFRLHLNPKLVRVVMYLSKWNMKEY